MHILSADDIKKSVSMAEAIAAVEAAYAEYSAGEAKVPLRIPVETARQQGVTLFMPAYSSRQEAMGVKIVSVYPGNTAVGLPTIHALEVMVDGTTGKPIAVMEAGYLTALRTAAASGVATKYLARENASVLAVIGAGAQARTQLEAVSTVRNITNVLVYDVNENSVAQYIRDMTARTAAMFGGKVGIRRAESAQAAAAEADIIVAATTSLRPVVTATRLKAGVHINGVGSFTPQMQEIGEDVVARAKKVVVDSREAVLAEAGDILVPLHKGLLRPESLVEIGEIAAGIRPGRENDQEITFFKTVGIALLDTVVGNLAYQKALAKGLGVNVAI